jgi:hypothetical protein
MATKNPGRELTGYHRAALRRLEASGAEFALMASTPHHRYASIVRGIGIPSSTFLKWWQRKALDRGQGGSDTRH